MNESVELAGTGADAEFVDLDRADVPHLLGRCLGLLPAARRVRPRGVADQVAVEGRRPRGDLEGRAHARTRRDRVSERLRRLGGARDDGGPLPLGTEMLNLTPVAGAPVVFVNVTVVSCEDPGENVWSPGGVAVADAGARLSRGTSYLAATTLACTSWSVASVGKVPAAVIAPS